MNGKEAALQLIDGGGGVITPYGVVYDNGMKLEPAYNGHQFPSYLYDHSLLVLEITPKRCLVEGSNPEYLYLPASKHQIERTLLRVGITTLHDAAIRIDWDELPEMVVDALELDHLSGDDLPALNRMCQSIEPLKDADMEKLNAVVLFAEAGDMMAVRQLAENLDQFDFVPGLQTPEEYGRHMIRESGHFDYDENLEGFYDYRRYGEQQIQQEGGQFNEIVRTKEQSNRPVLIYGTESQIPILRYHLQSVKLDNDATLQKLNQLAETIDGMNAAGHYHLSKSLDTQFQQNLDDVLQIAAHIKTSSLDCYEVIPGVTSHQELGRWLVEHDRLEDRVPEALRPYLDYRSIGIDYCNSHEGEFLADSYTGIQSGAMEQVLEEQGVLRLTLSTAKGTFPLSFPASDERLEQAKRALDVEDFAQASMAGAKTHILRKPFDQGNTKHFPGQRMIFDPLCEFPYDAGTSCDGYDQRIGGQDIYRIRQRPEESLIQYINHQRKGGERDAEGRQRRQEEYPF
ncbi:hypothetical protein AALC17_09890 [Oscillospiraceae bacterium 38-13]